MGIEVVIIFVLISGMFQVTQRAEVDTKKLRNDEILELNFQVLEKERSVVIKVVKCIQYAK